MTNLEKLKAQQEEMQKHFKEAIEREEAKMKSEAEEDSKKILVEKLPTGTIQLGILNNSNTNRLTINLKAGEAQELTKQLLSCFDDFTFTLDPAYTELLDLSKEAFGTSRKDFVKIENVFNSFIKNMLKTY